ncbi:signal peptidase II [Actinomycetospora sp. CA-101289]|uniref:signal peptidase II n=1 Tax=Actinomycetospora sp. CA-101289 TaxID=3239893 RepID=UPI003D99039D
MSSSRPARVRLALAVVGLVAGSVAVGRTAERALADGGRIDLALLQLRLTYNTGAAFSLGAGLPDGVLLVATAVVSTAIAIYTWRVAPTASWATRLGLVAILGGAVSNLIDRADDGAVIDYLHTGWWPTFNLPDTLITLGAGALVLAALRNDRQSADDTVRSRAEPDPKPKAPIEASTSTSTTRASAVDRPPGRARGSAAAERALPEDH